MLGKNKREICKCLDAKQIITPARYKMQYSNYKNPNKKLSGWSTSTITNILKDRTYIGDLVQHKYTSVNYKIKKVIKLEESKYIIIHNNHESIIKKDDYDKVQQMLKNRANECKRYKETLHILTGIGFCEKCGARITYTKNHGTNYKIICSNYKKNGARACTNIYLDENKVIEVIKDKIIENITKNGIDNMELGDSKKEGISKIQRDIDKNKYAITKLYEDRKEEIITDKMAKELISKYIKENKAKEMELERIKKIQNKVVDVIEEINASSIEELRSLILILISKVTISKETLTIYYNYPQ